MNNEMNNDMMMRDGTAADCLIRCMGKKNDAEGGNMLTELQTNGTGEQLFMLLSNIVEGMYGNFAKELPKELHGHGHGVLDALFRASIELGVEHASGEKCDWFSRRESKDRSDDCIIFAGHDGEVNLHGDPAELCAALTCAIDAVNKALSALFGERIARYMIQKSVLLAFDKLGKKEDED